MVLVEVYQNDKGAMMTIYKVRLWFKGRATWEIEAENDEAAEEEATEMLHEIGGISVNVYDAEVTKSDNQYTDQEELQDREKDL
jgi:hypothetical protein